MRQLTSPDIVIDPSDRHVVRGGGLFGRLFASRSRVKIASNRPDKPKASRKPRRSRAPLLSPAQKIACAAVALVAVLTAGFVMWRVGLPQQVWRQSVDGVLMASAEAGLRVSDITVTGRERTGSDEILMALGAVRNSPILAVDLHEAEARLETLPTVRSAIVERRLPTRLDVILTERRPVALWQHDGQFSLVDRDGHQIPGSIEGFQSLPLVVGDGAPAAAPELFVLLAQEPTLQPRVKAAVRAGGRRWNLKLDDAVQGMEVRLPESDVAAALRQLADLERDRALSARHVVMVDLRQSDRMVVKTEPEPAAPTPPTPHKEAADHAH